MKELSLEQMSEVEGGSCASLIAGGVGTTIALGIAIATGSAGWIGFGVAAVVFGIDLGTNGNECPDG